MDKDKLVAVVKSYIRAAFASVLALYLAGQTDIKTLAMAGVAAIAAPLLKALDKSEEQFGLTK
jgi:ornithine cyclodeaminase/alanine dehydrogenase-like protein (mu-crystallin family)